MRKRCVVQNFFLIWLDANIDESNDEYRNSINQLQSIINTIDIFKDIDQCIDFLTEIKDETIFMIVSGSLIEQIVPFIHNISQLKSIFVFTEDKERYEQLIKNWSKIKGVFTEIIQIREPLSHATRQCDENSISPSFISTSDTSNQNVDELDQTFMYTQILKEILFELKYDEQSIKDFVTYCRENYADNRVELKIIDKFERDYHLNLPIWWYTYPCFIYSMLNRALRIQEVETIIKMGFFVQDLHRNIYELHSKQFSDAHIQSFTVYRGQGLSKENFEKMIQTKGGLMSFNNFLSTSKDRGISFTFAESIQSDPELIGILFKITVNSSISFAPFALLNNVSYYADAEEEILFSMHTVFRIGEMKQINGNDRLWEVELQLTSDNDEQLNALTERLRTEILVHASGWFRLGALLLKLGEFDKAYKLYETLLGQTSDNMEKLIIYNKLGWIHRCQGNFEEAMGYFKKALEILNEIGFSNNAQAVISYNDISLLYRSIGDYPQALAYQKKALEICQETLTADHFSLGFFYNNVASIYQDMGKYAEALPLMQKAVDIREKTLPSNHPDLALAYNNIALVFLNMKKYSEALTFCEKALRIRQKYLPPNHRELGQGYNNIGLIYNEMDEYSKALESHQKALDIRQKQVPLNHSDLAQSYTNIGLAYSKMNECLKALSFHKRSVELQERFLSPDHPDLATTYNNIGAVYSKLGQYKEGLVYHEKALQIRQKTLPFNHPHLVFTYTHLVIVYRGMVDTAKAIFFSKKILEINQSTLPPNHPDLAQSYDNIGDLYNDMKDFQNACLFYEKALEIRRICLSPNHYDLANSYDSTGGAYWRAGENAKALLLLEKALEIYREILPSTHRKLGKAYNNVGSSYWRMGEHRKALSFHEKALEIRLKSSPPDYFDLSQSNNCIGTVYCDLGEYWQALPYHERAVEFGEYLDASYHHRLQFYRHQLELLREKLSLISNE